MRNFWYVKCNYYVSITCDSIYGVHDLCAECPQNLECDSNGENCQCKEGFTEESECCDCEEGYYQNGTSCISELFG